MTFPGLVRANNLNDIVDQEKAWDNLGDGIATGDISIATPSLDLNFAANKSLVDDISGNNLITFSRASTGTFVGSNGLIQTAASGVPRFDHNPATGESIGLLVEEARTNELTQSQTFSTWTLGNASITTNATTSPDGTSNASKLIEDNTTNVHRISLSINPTGTYTMTVFAKAAERNILTLIPATTGGGDTPVYFDLSNGTISGSLGSANSASIQSYPNGWYRCSVTDGMGGFGYPFIGVAAVSGTQSYAGNGTSGIFIWGAQLEAGSFPTSYIPTTTATVTRAADVASITGANFSSWYNQAGGTVLINYKRYPGNPGVGYPSPWTIRDSVPGAYLNGIQVYAEAGNTYDRLGGTNIAVTPSVTLPNPYGRQDKNAAAFINGSQNMAVNGTIGTASSSNIYTSGTVNQLVIAPNFTFKRLLYWPSRLNDKSLQYITQQSINTINLYSFSYSVTGKEVLALNAVRNTSTRDFIFIKGLLSSVQPRLNTASQNTSSGVLLDSFAMPKLAPTTSGNYFFSTGLALSGVTTRINGTNARSIATSPFSGSTATAPLLFRELRPQANWRITEPMPSGTIASPVLAIPFETNDFVLFIKAGQN